MPINIKNLAPTGYKEREVSDAINQIARFSLSWGGDVRPLGSQYYQGEIVVDGAWTMVCVRDTTDRPAPQTVGDILYDIPDVPGFTTGQFTGAVETEHTYDFSKAGWVRALQVWVPAIGANIDYQFVYILERPNENPVAGLIPTPVALVANGWNTLSVGNTVLGAGTKLTLRNRALNSTGNTTWTHNWVYEGTSQNASPDAGGWNRNNQHVVLRINELDESLTDRTTDLDQIISGSVINITQGAGNLLSYSVLDVTKVLDIYTFDVLQLQSTGTIVAGISTAIEADIPVPAATEYSQNVDYWDANQPSFATVTGLREEAGAPIAGTDNDAFGWRIAFQEGAVSPDWEVMAYNGE